MGTPKEGLVTDSSKEALMTVIKEFKTHPHTPELFQKYWQIKFDADGQKAGFAISVPECDRTTEEIAELETEKRTLVYLPDELTTSDGLVILGKMYPKLDSLTVREQTPIRNDQRKGGWLDIEASIVPPYLNVDEKSVRDVFTASGVRGQRLATYILGSEMSHDLRSCYLDETASYSFYSRLLGSSWDGDTIRAFRHSDGALEISNQIDPITRRYNLGARSERFKKDFVSRPLAFV